MDKLKEFWTKNSKVILIAGAAILAYFIYTKNRK
ncbi:hypothetical protein FlaCF_2467 [Flavobacterium tructae]